MRTRIKFCGMTRPEDAAAAVALGVDAIGMIFVPGAARRISIDRAREIISVVGPFVTPVAVFANASADEIRDVTSQLAINTVQLHGSETVNFLGQLSHLQVIKAGPDESWAHADIAGFLFDTPGPGGAGVENDWDSLLQVRPKFNPFIAAGGLTPDNVAGVIRRLRPYGVDVSSGIEESKGIKSVDKMRAFVTAVREGEERKNEPQMDTDAHR